MLVDEVACACWEIQYQDDVVAIVEAKTKLASLLKFEFHGVSGTQRIGGYGAFAQLEFEHNNVNFL